MRPLLQLAADGQEHKLRDVTLSTPDGAAPGLLARGLMHGFASVPMPLPCPRLPMYLIWHRRHHDDEAHRWLRSELEALVPSVLAGGTAA